VETISLKPALPTAYPFNLLLFLINLTAWRKEVYNESFEMKEGEPFDWKAFQKHMQFTDEELEAFMSHPKKAKSVEYLFNPKFRNKFLVVEVVESKACGNGLVVATLKELGAKG